MKSLLIPVVLYLLTQFLFSQTSDKWITDFETSRFIATPCYDESMEYFQQLTDFSQYAEFRNFGDSPQGRDLKYLIVSKDMEFDSEHAKRSGKPLVLIINGIHSGEIEGKDASMILLREMLVTKEKENIIDSLILIVVPIFNVDGHERSGKYNRINQNGPEEMGWRTTAQNLNLNRDWLKADAPEMQAILKLFNAWLPDFIIDSHTTDGADYQYNLTYLVEKYRNIYSGTADWMKKRFIPYLEASVEQKGFLIHPYIYLKDHHKGFDGGIIDWASTPRFSTGYAALQNRPSLLIETHMIKPYKDRVYSTKATFEAVLKFVSSNASALIDLNKRADENSVLEYSIDKNYLPISFEESEKYDEVNLKGYKYIWEKSDISGAQKLVYTKEKKEFNVKYYNDVIATDSIDVPDAYIIPKEWWDNGLSRLQIHGVKTKYFQRDTTILVKKYKFNNVKFDSASYEGNHRVSFETTSYIQEVLINTGDVYVPTNQRTIRVIVNLLEPDAGDSFVRWGFMNSIFERKEHVENYVMEKLAEEMLIENAELRKEFEAKLNEDEEFRKNPKERLDFFYKRSPYYDKNYQTYPVMRIE
jgi:hypothetical protein